MAGDIGDPSGGEINKSDEEINKNWSNRLLYIGSGLIVISIIFAVISHYQYPDISQMTTYVASLVSSGGVALVIVALVESRHLQKSLEKTSKKIVIASALELDEKFKETFEILEHSKYNGLIDILAPRQDIGRGRETKKIIAAEIKKSESILVYSISALDFFGYPGGAGPGGMYYSIIWHLIETASKDKKPLGLDIKALLMDSNSEAAEFRDHIETYVGSRADIKRDISVACEGINNLNEYAGENFIDYVLYTTFPQAGFIITDSTLFIEPYHFAPTKELCNALKGRNLEASALIANCTGGRIPVLQFSCDSNMYIAMQKHFESIWNYEKEKQN